MPKRVTHKTILTGGTKVDELTLSCHQGNVLETLQTIKIDSTSTFFSKAV